MNSDLLTIAPVVVIVFAIAFGLAMLWLSDSTFFRWEVKRWHQRQMEETKRAYEAADVYHATHNPLGTRGAPGNLSRTYPRERHDD